MQWNISYDHQGIAHCDNIPRSSITSYLLLKQVIFDWPIYAFHEQLSTKSKCL